MQARMQEALAPFPAGIQQALDRTMPPGRAPLRLFTTLARDPRLFGKFFAGGLLDRGHLTLRQREIVIARTTALCRSEYEWGVHITLFGTRAGFGGAQVRSLARGGSEDGCWTDEERDLLRLCESLHRECQVDDGLWQRLKAQFADEAMLELLMLAGFYRTVSYLTNALQLPPETDGARFPAN
ncbi:MAG: carboxymuconolactone decarboxylase family protein [Burkholderiaceae bacterium]|nr:carboxymuconolactone decarboxylase family protein [Burkholderiaceae bacterium]